MTATTWPLATPLTGRDTRLDRLRGLAILLMVGDHLALCVAGGDVYRYTLGRLALPIFFVLAGHLAGRLRWRHAGAALVGLGLAALIPWLDSPNVLVWWAIGCAVLYGCRSVHAPVVLVVVAGAAVAANGWLLPGDTYQPCGLLVLMAAGAMLPRSAFRSAAALPAWLASLGRRPLLLYAGHLFVLQAVYVALGWSQWAV